MAVLALDTSNYTTSVAVFDGQTGCNRSKLLEVRPGELGLRQSDALFQHVNVIETIPEGGTGQVELTDAAGSRITYLAKYQFADFEPRGPIQAGTVVKVLDTENNLLVVGRLF